MLVKDDAKEIRDNRLPVSKQLLAELVAGADKVLVGHNKLLAKTLFTTAWAFSMRISEFSLTKVASWKKIKSHNIWANSVRTSDVGLSVTFESDKTSKFSQGLKHRTVVCRKLPGFTRKLVKDYTAI